MKNPRAFTLLELMIAVMLLALLTAAVGLSFEAPLKKQRADDAIAAIRTFDADARTAASIRGETVRLIFDFANQTLSRQTAAGVVQNQISMSSADVKQIDIEGESQNVASDSHTAIDISANGWGRSYAVELGDRWLTFAGLSGQSAINTHEPDFNIPDQSVSSRHNAD